MTPRECIRETARAFCGAGIPDPVVDASALLALVTGEAPLRLRLDGDRTLTQDELARFSALRDERLARTPLQYLTHEQSFLGHSFYVDPRVLIPRPETELLAERTIAAADWFPLPRVLDLCCGSGCLCVSTALALPRAQVHGADLSRDALDVARRNADALGALVSFHQGDLLDAVAGLTFEVIVSNPPYIPDEECGALQEEVRREPAMALRGGADGLDFYRRIAAGAASFLEPGGVLLLEAGYGQAEAIMALLREHGLTDAAAYPDLQGIPRMVEARRP